MSADSPRARIRALLQKVEGKPLTRDGRRELAEQVAAELLLESTQLTERADEARTRMLSRLMLDPKGQVLTTALTDRLYRAKDESRVVDQVAHLLSRLGLPQYMSLLERLELLGVGPLSRVAPKLLARAIVDRVRKETRAVLLSAEPKVLASHLATRHAEYVRVNVNQLGEALLGEDEAEQRVQKYVALASRGDVDSLSVKVSSIGSQLNLLAFDQTAETLARRLARIYAATLSVEASKRPTIMLDMEAYQDIELTFAVMERALSDRSLDAVRAGIVLQAYLPDSNAWQRHLIRWARERTLRGAEPIRMRLVKGANLAQERVDSSRMGVTVPIFAHKHEVDANYKRMLERALTPEALEAVELGIASHNLFDLAYALVLGAERRAGRRMGFELLEGMADPLRRTLSRLDLDVLVYAPICGDDEMNSGIAYLVRRLDENTSSDNFLRSSFGMRPFDEGFMRERDRFRRACAEVDRIDETQRRAGDENHDRSEGRRAARSQDFVNELDTDFSTPQNRAWISAALDHERERAPFTVRSFIAGKSVEGQALIDGFDPSRPGHAPYRIALASASDVERALACAAADVSGFSKSSLSERAMLLSRIAEGLRRARAELISAMVLDAGKRVVEADAEVSEAIDFAEYYRASLLRLKRETPVELEPYGTVVVTPPWNFPCAIPAGGVLAALMAGNRVILKPALETAHVAACFARVFVRAGVPADALQLVVCEDEVASLLIQDPRTDVVILTGATDTARLFQRMRPGLRLYAETGGKNAYIVSAMSDRELAIKNVVQSAFGHAGQKCSAASLLILEAEVYDDPYFMQTLKDSVESLAVGAAWDPTSFVTPLIREPEGPLARALSTLEPAESWLVMPRVHPDNPRLFSPGVKLGVSPGSFTHTTELFGPVLGVMRADNLDHAIELANQTGYGLTAGLASLDEREVERFEARIHAGNVYVNRTITGAIVERQPFGGVGKSGFGPGAKAGGPNYVLQLCRVADAPARSTRSTPLSSPIATRLTRLEQGLSPDAREELARRAHDYAHAYAAHFASAREQTGLLGQDNLFRYVPGPGIVLRVAADAEPLDVASACLAADLVGARLSVSLHPAFRGSKDGDWLGHAVHVETAGSLVARAPSTTRVRVVGSREPELDDLNRLLGAHLEDAPVLRAGRVELLRYVHEQSLSIDYHRYGNLGERGL
jgi:RHH-type proline utilization regulon transcriptional repressor/proline dehydrogenase/delta 1-pyrroline-5-carboxylate dehydrogenase